MNLIMLVSCSLFCVLVYCMRQEIVQGKAWSDYNNEMRIDLRALFRIIS